MAMNRRRALASIVGLFVLVAAGAAFASPAVWEREWPNTDFSKHSIDYDEVLSGGPPKDGIPAIDDPIFLPLAEAKHITAMEPVIGVVLNGEAKAYPLAILIWHEIVNDTVGGVPVAVTFCPLCNAAIVFDRRVEGRVLDFGTTGKLRHSDLIMYDRQTESWWQQFLGEGIVGEMIGKRLALVPARIESLERFKARAPNGEVLFPNNPRMRRYGANPYIGYDSSASPFLYRGDLPEDIAPLARVVSFADDQAWSLDLLREKKRIEAGDVVITWEPGQTSALDDRVIAHGADVGNVVVQRRTADGLTDIPYGMDFAFAFKAFRPNAKIHVKD
jgi:hypothetical protein